MAEELVHNEPKDRFELIVDGELASFAEYRASGDVLVFDHTVTDPAFRGQGLAARVVQFALEHARETNRTVVPQCWFVREFIESNPEFEDLVAA
jgi:uncharacterized protein